MVHNRRADAYRIASSEDEWSSSLWLSGLFAVPCIPKRDWSGVRVVDSAPAERGAHPECPSKINLQDDLLVTSRDESGIRTRANSHRVKVTYIVKPLRACSRCMVGDRKRCPERRSGTPAD